MSQSYAVMLLIALAFFGANVPFFSSRLFAFFALSSSKTWWQCFIELLVFYLLCGAVGIGLESYGGQRSPQSWEFYPITAALFLTFAFPGFVYRYLLRR